MAVSTEDSVRALKVRCMMLEQDALTDGQDIEDLWNQVTQLRLAVVELREWVKELS